MISAAVSQQVKALEALYGTRLFLRIGNRIMLTDAGDWWSRCCRRWMNTG